MSLASILEQEIRGEIAQIQQGARQQSDEIVAQARAQAQSLTDSRARSLEAEYQAGLTRARSAASLEVSALRLSGADRVQAQAFQEAERQLRAVTVSEYYTDILGHLIAEARAALPQAEAVEVNPNDQDRAREALNSLGWAVEVRPNPAVETGVRLVGAGGKTGVQNTLLGRLEASRDALASQVAQVLRG